MKTTLNILLVLFLVIAPSSSVAQNQDIIGATTAEQVREEHPVFDIYTNRYTPDEAAINYLSSIEDSVQIYVLFGTWCHDSKKQIPAFMKTLEVANNSSISVDYIAVSRKKKEPENIVEKWDLKLTPTFIIYRYGKEVGRIIEEPIEKLEQDLVTILKSES